MSEPSTPLMRQYAAIKKEHPNALLFFRLGDFYELFFEDAVLAARELQITLTSRNKEKGIEIPMCGVPYHAAEGYISKLIRRGFKVAVCEQVEDPRLAQKLGAARGDARSHTRHSRRFVTECGGEQLSGRGGDGRGWVGFAALDLSTGEFRATEFAGESAGRRIQEELEQLRPKEMLYGSSAPLFEAANRGLSCRQVYACCGRQRLRPRHEAVGRNSSRRLDLRARPRHSTARKSFWSALARRLWLAGKPAAASAAGAILYYIRSTQRGTLITSTASASTSGRTAWCSTRSRCATWN
jgi:DNA mismatch repair protein MutS